VSASVMNFHYLTATKSSPIILSLNDSIDRPPPLLGRETTDSLNGYHTGEHGDVKNDALARI